MTILLDIAALAALALSLTFVPLLGLREERRITRQIRAAQRSRERAAEHRTRPASGQAAAGDRAQQPRPLRRLRARHNI